MKNIKETVNELLSIYVLNRESNKNIVQTCAKQLFMQVYCNPERFGIFMKKDEMSDFLTFLYPKTFKSIFENYDQSKSSFFTFICTCLKYQKSFFFKKEFKKQSKDAIVLQEFEQDIKHEVDEFYEFDYKKCLKNYTDFIAKMPQEEDMAKQLEKWKESNAFGRGVKNIKKLIFFSACKSAPFLDDVFIYKIAKYIDMSFDLLSYYILKFNVEFMKCNQGIIESKENITKYFLRKMSFERILQLDYATESQRYLIMKSLKYSEQKYEKAKNVLKMEVKCISNRRIAKITGFSRSSIDRLFLNSSSILSKIKK